MKKWVPFIILVSIAIITFVNLVFLTEAPYEPQTADPEIIYYEACSDCHGENGQGSGVLYPAFDNAFSSRVEIEKNIKNGGWLMPKFKHINGDTLKKLVNYIYEKKYLD